MDEREEHQQRVLIAFLLMASVFPKLFLPELAVESMQQLGWNAKHLRVPRGRRCPRLGRHRPATEFSTDSSERRHCPG